MCVCGLDFLCCVGMCTLWPYDVTKKQQHHSQLRGAVALHRRHERGAVEGSVCRGWHAGHEVCSPRVDIPFAHCAGSGVGSLCAGSDP